MLVLQWSLKHPLFSPSHYGAVQAPQYLHPQQPGGENWKTSVSAGPRGHSVHHHHFTTRILTQTPEGNQMQQTSKILFVHRKKNHLNRKSFMWESWQERGKDNNMSVAPVSVLIHPPVCSVFFSIYPTRVLATSKNGLLLLLGTSSKSLALLQTTLVTWIFSSLLISPLTLRGQQNKSLFLFFHLSSLGNKLG